MQYSTQEQVLTSSTPKCISSAAVKISSYELILLRYATQMDDFFIFGMVFFHLRLRNSHLGFLFIVINHLAASMIIGTNFVDRHVRVIRCVEGIVETIGISVHILGSHRATANSAEAAVDKTKPMDGTPADPETGNLSRSSIRAIQTIRMPPMTQVPVFVRFQLPGLVNTEPKHAVFVNNLLKITNSMHKIYPDKPFIVVASRFSHVPRKSPKNMVRNYATWGRKLLIPADSPLVAHVSESL